MSIEAMKQALEALELARSTHDVMLLSDPPQKAWKYHNVDWKLLGAVNQLRQAIAEAEKQYNATSDARLMEMPKQQPDYKALWEQMCERCDELDMKLAEAEKQEPVAWVETHDNGEINWGVETVISDDPSWLDRPMPVYTAPPQRQPLYPREVKDVLRATGYVTNSQAWELAEEVMKLLAAHGIKGEA